MSEVHRLYPENVLPLPRPVSTVESSTVAQLAAHIGERLPDRRQQIAAVLLSNVTNDEAIGLITRISVNVAPDQGTIGTVSNARSHSSGQPLIG